jgi:4-hydroxy-tetrahydrodipicolinate reductase
VFEALDLDLVAAVSRRHAGEVLGEAIGCDGLATPVFSTAEEALEVQPDVFVEYTKPGVAKGHVISALEHGAHVVIGTSGLTGDTFQEIDELALEARRGVLAVGNFALTAVLLMKFAETAAKYVPNWEIIDYADSGKRDVPSGTVRELADRLSAIQEPHLDVPLSDIEGPKESRGVRLQGSQIHSVRLPGYTISVDAIFGMPDQKLILSHESGSSAEPYVGGALLAIRGVGNLVGLHRGLDSVMEI